MTVPTAADFFDPVLVRQTYRLRQLRPEIGVGETLQVRRADGSICRRHAVCVGHEGDKVGVWRLIRDDPDVFDAYRTWHTEQMPTAHQRAAKSLLIRQAYTELGGGLEQK